MNQKRKERRWGRIASAWLLCAVMILPAILSPVGAMALPAVSTDTQNQESRAANSGITLTYGGKKLSVSAKMYNGYLYVPLGDFTKQFTQATYRYDSTTKYATLTASGLTIAAGVGGTFITANDRPLYVGQTNRMINGTVWVPLETLAKAMSLTVTYKSSTATAAISGTYRALTPASRFYREDEVLWLSRIISAESRGEPFRGQIAVGNVILNRTRSVHFPNTIWGVIFEKGQFAPVSNGSVYNDPTWSSVIAAKICLEGYRISSNILFFTNIKHATSHWIEANRTFAFKIGNHSFYN